MKLEFNEECEHFKKARKLALDNNYDNHEAERFAEGYFTARAEMLSSATVVSGDLYGWHNEKRSEHTMKALLINIEPIVKEPCKHEPQPITIWITSKGHVNQTDYECKHCGVKLVNEWKEKS